MRLESVRLERLPGLRRALELDALPAGACVVLGPNGSGKTSLARGVRDLVWRRREAPGAGEARWSTGGGVLVASYGPGRELAFRPRAPDVPDARFARLYFLDLDVFRDAGARADIEEELRRELTAGFDPQAVRADLRKRWKQGGQGRVAANRLRDLDRIAAARRDEHGALERERRTLQELEERLEASADAERRAAALERALAALRAADRLSEVERELATLPAALAQVRADDRERLQQLLQRRDERARVRDRASARVAEFEARLAEAPALDGVREWTERIDVMATAQEVDARRSEEALAREQLAKALGGRAHTATLRPPDADELRELDALLAVDAAARAALDHARERRDELASMLAAEPAAQAGDVDAARAALARWLEAGSSGAGEPAPRRGTLGLAALLAVALVAVGALARAQEPLLVVAALAASAALGFLVLRSLRRPDAASAALARARADEVARFARTGVRAPEPWRTAEVAQRLDELAREVERRASRSRLEADAKAAARRADGRETDAAAARGELARWLEAHGIVATGALEARQLAHDLQRAGELRAELERAEGRRREAETRLAAGRAKLREVFARVAVPVPDDPADAQLLLDRLAAALEQRRAWSAELDRARLALDDARGAAAGAQMDVEGFCSQRRLDATRAEPGLHELCAHVPRWEELGEERRELQAALRAARVAEDELARWRAAGSDTLASSLARSRAEVDERRTLLTHAERLRLRLEQAEQGDALEVAQAEARAAADATRAIAAEGLATAAVDFLLEDVEREHDAAPRSELLARAGRLFERFTAGGWRLAPPTASDERERARGFRVLDDRGDARAPDELSSATLAQLELALRLGLLEHVEHGRESLPVFLDEVLTHSDPARFAAIATALVELARGGRQVLFLTSDPVDAARLVRAGEAAGERVSVLSLDGATPPAAEPGALDVDASAPIPRPSGRSAAQYASELGVPAIDPFAPADALHPFHLFRDDLDAVHALARARVATVGRLRSLARRGGALPRLVVERLDERARAAEALLLAYRGGRAAPAPPEVVLEALGGSTKLPEVLAVLEDVRGDGAALLARLEAKAVPGLRKSFIEALEVRLRAGEHVADGEALTGEALVERALELAGADGVDERERLAAVLLPLARTLELNG